MTFQEQVEKLITRLTEPTAQQKVAWQETGSEDTYIAPIGGFVVSVSTAGPGAYGGYFLQIHDNQGRTVEEVLATLLGAENVSSRDILLQDWERLRSLHELARRSALKSDQVVSDLLSSLEQIH